MKNLNKNGFTLMELLAVIIILGVIMTIAIPNVVSMIERNKKEVFIENAKDMIAQSEYTIRKDTKIEYPTKDKAIIITLKYLNTNDITDSPYGTKYSQTKSFVAITNKTSTNGVIEYKYYAHLVSCTDLECENEADNSVNKNRGLNLLTLEQLNSGDRFSLLKRGSEAFVDLINEKDKILSMIGATTITDVYDDLKE